MSWGAWVVLALYVVACAGPLRRPFFRQWRFTVPASLGGWVAFYLAGLMLPPGGPAWGRIFVALMVGLGGGAATKRWLDEELKQ